MLIDDVEEHQQYEKVTILFQINKNIMNIILKNELILLKIIKMAIKTIQFIN